MNRSNSIRSASTATSAATASFWLCTEMYSPLVDILRELSGGGVFQMPASVDVMHDPHLKGLFETYWQTPQLPALDRVKLYKLVWDLVGSEFAGRHLQYEKFYAGASFIVRGHNYTHAPWDHFHNVVDGLLKSYDIPAEYSTAAKA